MSRLLTGSVYIIKHNCNVPAMFPLPQPVGSTTTIDAIMGHYAALLINPTSRRGQSGLRWPTAQDPLQRVAGAERDQPASKPGAPALLVPLTPPPSAVPLRWSRSRPPSWTRSRVRTPCGRCRASSRSKVSTQPAAAARCSSRWGPCGPFFFPVFSLTAPPPHAFHNKESWDSSPDNSWSHATARRVLC